VTFSFIGYVMMLAGVAIGTLAFGERLPWTIWPAAGLVLAALLMLPSPPARRHLPAVRCGRRTPA